MSKTANQLAIEARSRVAISGGPGGRGAEDDQRPFHRGLRFSAKARMPSRKSSEAKHERRSSISSCSCSVGATIG